MVVGIEKLHSGRVVGKPSLIGKGLLVARARIDFEK